MLWSLICIEKDQNEMALHVLELRSSDCEGKLGKVKAHHLASTHIEAKVVMEC